MTPKVWPCWKRDPVGIPTYIPAFGGPITESNGDGFGSGCRWWPMSSEDSLSSNGTNGRGDCDFTKMASKIDGVGCGVFRYGQPDGDGGGNIL